MSLGLAMIVRDAADILCMSHRLNVLWPYAPARSAKMVVLQSVWRRTEQKMMSQTHPSLKEENAIAARINSPCPQPAGLTLFNTSPKAFFNGTIVGVKNAVTGGLFAHCGSAHLCAMFRSSLISTAGQRVMECAIARAVFPASLTNPCGISGECLAAS